MARDQLYYDGESLGGTTINALNFARSGAVRSIPTGTGDAGRAYVTIIEPTGTGASASRANWQVVQNYRVGNNVFTRRFVYTDITADAAYNNRDAIVANRAVEPYLEQSYTTK